MTLSSPNLTDGQPPTLTVDKNTIKRYERRGERQVKPGGNTSSTKTRVLPCTVCFVDHKSELNNQFPLSPRLGSVATMVVMTPSLPLYHSLPEPALEPPPESRRDGPLQE